MPPPTRSSSSGTKLRYDKRSYRVLQIQMDHSMAQRQMYNRLKRKGKENYQNRHLPGDTEYVINKSRYLQHLADSIQYALRLAF